MSSEAQLISAFRNIELLEAIANKNKLGEFDDCYGEELKKVLVRKYDKDYDCNLGKKLNELEAFNLIQKQKTENGKTIIIVQARIIDLVFALKSFKENNGVQE